METSAEICSVAIFDGEELIWGLEEMKERSHAQKLGGMVREGIMEMKRRELGIDAVAVSSGPGSYTGLRIGVSLAKGVCLGLAIPLISVPTLRIMLESFRDSQEKLDADFFIPLIDARRMDVYYSIFNREFQGLKEDSDLILDESSFEIERKEGNCIFFGNGSAKFSELIKPSGNAQFPEGGFSPLASHMGKEAMERFKRSEFEDLAYFEPKYVKDVFVTKPKPTFG